MNTLVEADIKQYDWRKGQKQVNIHEPEACSWAQVSSLHAPIFQILDLKNVINSTRDITIFLTFIFIFCIYKYAGNVEVVWNDLWKDVILNSCMYGFHKILDLKEVLRKMS